MICLLIGFYFFWGAFVLIGARMFFDALPLFFLLSARGLTELPELIRHIFKKLQPKRIEKYIVLAISAFVIYAFAYHFPRFLHPSHAGWFYEKYDHNFAGTTGRLDKAIASLNLDKSLIILKFLHRPFKAFSQEGGWGSGFWRDDPGLESRIIYARAGDPDLSPLFSCFPERKIYLYVGTLDKGMLLPLRREEDKIFRGEPLVPPKMRPNSTALVREPQDLFYVYSADFGKFLRLFFRDRDIAEVDGKRAEELGRSLYARRQFAEAAFCIEAALQVENDPEIRRALLDLLIPCYQKTGQVKEAKKLIEFMEKVNFDERRMYAVFPERGF
jgi:tetratricopeptide (TPR) repeat protein